MHNLKELKVWQKSLDLIILIYQILKSFPDDEKFGLISQIKRSAISIPSNIAEGAGRNSNKEFAQFLSIANASSYELLTQLIISQKLSFISVIDFETITKELEEIQKMIYKLKETISKY